MVIGLDCAPPKLIFERLCRRLPNLSALIARGAHGNMRSCVPPITVPAWPVMVSGRDPGELGLYGFRAKRPGSYDLEVADSTWLSSPKTIDRLWDILAEAGKSVAVLYVPLTSPPSPVNGQLVSCFLTPGPEHAHTHPPALAEALRARFGEHDPDVRDFRSTTGVALLDQLYRSTRQHFQVARALWKEEKPDFMMLTEMGTDRLHHAFWRHLDPEHPKHDADHVLVREVGDYYAFLDAEIGALMRLAEEDTNVLVVSDHGARPLLGSFCVNEWLRNSGWLVLKKEPEHPGPLDKSQIDWSQTRAWAEAGYYSRVFFNVIGREPEGIVEPDALEGESEGLRQELRKLRMVEGRKIEAQVHRPQELYREVNGVAPDLLLFLSDLDYRASGWVGGQSLWGPEDERGRDDCNHDWDGIFIGAGPGVEAQGKVKDLSIFDLGPTALALMGVPTPSHWPGVDRSRA